jgi:uncharacterized coiled-coil DUF342 family protein
MILAQSTQFMGVEAGVLVQLATGLGVLYAVWRATNKAKKETTEELVSEVKKALALEAAKEAANVEKAPKLPQPFKITGETRLATFEELETVRKSIDALKEDVDEVGEKIGRVKDSLQLEGSRRSSQLNQRMDGLATDVTTAKTAVEYTGNQVVRLDQKVDRILERLKA